MSGIKKRIYLYICVLLSVICLGLFVVNETKGKVSAEETAVFQMDDGVSYRNCWSETHCGLTYSATINKTYYDTFSSGKTNVTVNLLIVPYEYVKGLGASIVAKFATAKSYINNGQYAEGFAEAKTQGAEFWYGIVDDITDGEVIDEDTVLKGGLKSIQTENANRRYFGIYYIEGKNSSGETVREYASFPTRTSDTSSTTNTVKAGRTSNSLAYVVSSLSLENRNEWETQNMTTFLKRSVEGALKASVSDEDIAKFNLEKFNEKGVNDLVKAEIEDITYGDDVFGVKVYGALVEESGESAYKEITNNLDFNLKWDFDELSGIDLNDAYKNGITVQEVKGAADTKATLTIGGNNSTVNFNVKQLSISDASSVISVADYEAVREENIDEVKETVRAEIKYASNDKRLTEKTFTFTPTCSGSGFGEYTASVSESGDFSGETSTTFNITQKKFKIIKGNTFHGDITLPSESVCDVSIGLSQTPASNYVFVNYVVDGTPQTSDSFIMPDRDIIVYATFEGRNCVITYYTDNGVSITQNVKYDESYSMETANKSGYTFAGWSEDKNESTEWNSGTKTCQGEKDYYAVWQKTWSFYDTASSTVTQNVNYAYNGAGTTYAKTNPTLSGYSFQGYSNTNATAATVAAGSSSTTVSNSSDANAKFYAVWLQSGLTETKTEYPTGSDTDTITYYGNGSTSGSTSTSTVNITINYKKVSQRTYSRRYNYSLSSNSDGIDYGSWEVVSNVETSRTRSAKLNDCGFNRTGYKPSQWAEGSASGTKYSFGSPYTGTATKFYAIWSAIPYAVKMYYYLNYGSQKTSLSGVSVELAVNGNSIGNQSTYDTQLGYDSTIGVLNFNDGGYAVQFYKINGEYYSIYNSASSSEYRKTITGDTTIEVYLSSKSNISTVISGKQVNRSNLAKTGDNVAGFDIGGVRKLSDDFYMEIYLTDLKGGYNTNSTTWKEFIWATFDLGMYDSTNVNYYRFVRLDNWSWTSSGCGIWTNETTDGSRDTSNWWGSTDGSTMKSWYSSGMTVDIRITKVGTNMYVIYHICTASGKWYRQYYKFTGMPTNLSMFISSEYASFTVGHICVSSTSSYTVIQPLNVTYGNGSGWNDGGTNIQYMNLFDISNVTGDFTFKANFTMDAMKNGDTNSGTATAQMMVYTPGNISKRIVGCYDWHVANDNSFAGSTQTCDGYNNLYKCNGTGYECTRDYGYFYELTQGDDGWKTPYKNIVDYATCDVEVVRSGSTITIKMWVLPSGSSQRYVVWHVASDCPTTAVGLRIAEQSTTYTMNSYSLT